MTHLAFIFFSSFLIALSGALIPGPMLAVTIKESLEQGWPAGVFISAGHGLAEIALLGIFSLGVSRVLQTRWVMIAVGIVGGAALLMMGMYMITGVLWRKRGLTAISDQGGLLAGGRASPTSFGRALGAGVVVSVANPTWIIWWLTIGILYVTKALQHGWLGLGVFYTGHILADFTWYVFIAFLVATGKKILTPITYNWVMMGCGMMMVFLALFFLFQGVQAVVL